MRLKVDNNEIRVFLRNDSVTECISGINGKKVKQVKEFLYLACMFSRNRTYALFIRSMSIPVSSGLLATYPL